MLDNCTFCFVLFRQDFLFDKKLIDLILKNAQKEGRSPRRRELCTIWHSVKNTESVLTLLLISCMTWASNLMSLDQIPHLQMGGLSIS